MKSYSSLLSGSNRKLVVGCHLAVIYKVHLWECWNYRSIYCNPAAQPPEILQDKVHGTWYMVHNGIGIPLVVLSLPPTMVLTTPFIPPPDCSIQDLTTITTTSYSTAETVLVLLSDPADPRFTECQPSDWASTPSSSRFSYSLAVCPSDWLAWSIATTELQAETVTTAWCCHTCVYSVACPPPGYSVVLMDTCIWI